MFVRVMTNIKTWQLYGPHPPLNSKVARMKIVKFIRNVKYPWYKIALTFIENSNFENEDYIDKMTNMPWVWTVAQRLEQQPRKLKMWGSIPCHAHNFLIRFAIGVRTTIEH